MQVRSLGREDPLEEEMATHSSILAWSVPWIEEPGRPQSVGSESVGRDWSDLAHMVQLLIYILTDYAGYYNLNKESFKNFKPLILKMEINGFIYIYNRYSLRVYYGPDTAREIQDTSGNKTGDAPLHPGN